MPEKNLSFDFKEKPKEIKQEEIEKVTTLLEKTTFEKKTNKKQKVENKVEVEEKSAKVSNKIFPKDPPIKPKNKNKNNKNKKKKKN